MRFVRQNILVISGKFYVPGNPTPTQPTSVVATLSYDNNSGSRVATNVSLSIDGTTKVWSGSWDSSDAKAGRVDYVIVGSGAAQAATEGFFDIVANRANV